MKKTFAIAIKRSIATIEKLEVRPRLSVEALTFLMCVYLVLCCNDAFWQAAMMGRSAYQPSTWVFFFATVVGLTALHFILVVPFMARRSVKPLLLLLLLASGMASYFTQRYHVFFDSGMLRNVFRTDAREASELLTPGLLRHLIVLVGPAWFLLWINRTPHQPLLFRAALIRLLWLAVSVGLTLAATLLVFQDVASLMRNQKAVRYLITPGNLIVSSFRLATASSVPDGPKKVVGADAQVGTSWKARNRPALLVLVVGETARAANWGLNGYSRQTTPELASLGVLNFSDVTACGTNTEVSVPCMFSPYGRHSYDEVSIRSNESLLHVLNRAGIGVLWRDNQSGCKGVCSGLEIERTDSISGQHCGQDGCLDEVMLQGLEQRINRTPGSMVVVLHQIGNHGPAYFRRHPTAHRAYLPSCDSAELSDCSREQIINSYDNAMRYTDHFLAETIRLLARQSSHDTALLYISDHGESLGEHGIYLHGFPHAIAPEEQTRIPMVMWHSPGYAASFHLDRDCLQRASARPLSHDNLFHTVLGMLDIRSSIYEPRYDFTADCRSASA